MAHSLDFTFGVALPLFAATAIAVAAVGFHPLDSLPSLSRPSLMHRKPLTMRPFRVALLIAIRHAACYLLHHARELATPVA